MKNCILLVEDNELIRENTIEILELSNYEVLAACDGLQALEILKAGKPNLILCDIQMPQMNGYDFYAATRSNRFVASVPFIFLTAYSERTDISKALEMGAQDYIVKPFDADDLIDLIRKYLPD